MKPLKSDRVQTAIDEKTRLLELSKMNLVAPEAGFCDPPLRVYPLNNEWAKIIMGLVSHLATIAPWDNGQDETDVAIQEVIKFMAGCDPCAMFLECLQGIVDTPYGDLSETLRDLLDAIRALANSEGNADIPVIYNDNPDLLDGIEGCDLDNLFGACTGLIDYTYAGLKDFLEILEASTSNLETARTVIAAIPVLGWLPFDEILELGDLWIENLRDNFFSAYTQTVRDELRCGLFCRTKENCKIPFIVVAGYFTELAGEAIQESDLEDLVEFLTQGFFSGTELVYTAFAFYWWILAFGGSVRGDSPEHVSKAAKAMYNDPDPDWQTLCDECLWSYVADFTTGENGWSIDTFFMAVFQGVYVSGTGWQTTWQDNGVGGHDSSRAVTISHPLSASTKILHAVVTYDMVNSGNWDGTNQNIELVRTPTLALAVKTSDTDATDNDKTLSFEGEESTTQDSFVISLKSGRLYDANDPGGQVTIKHVAISGVGDNPFE